MISLTAVQGDVFTGTNGVQITTSYSPPTPGTFLACEKLGYSYSPAYEWFLDGVLHTCVINGVTNRFCSNVISASEAFEAGQVWTCKIWSPPSGYLQSRSLIGEASVTIAPPIEEPKAICIDTESFGSGDVLRVTTKGTCINALGEIYEDVCIDNTYLKDYYCTPEWDPTHCSYVAYNCITWGFAGCINGACSNNLAAPIGYDASNCDVIQGWTCDADNYALPLDVHIYDGPCCAKPVTALTANLQREPGVASSCGGNANHGFSFPTPASLKDGLLHNIYIYAINIDSAGSTSGDNPQLTNTPKTLTCAPIVNGACGSTNNACTAGTLNDIADSSTNYLWKCTGSGGGTTASCSVAKLSCTSFTYSAWGTCTSGTQTRTVLTSSPTGCIGGNPILTQSCTSTPSTPAGLTVGTPTSSSLVISWTASAGADSYKLYRNGILILSAPPTATSYTNTGLTASTTYSYTIAAVNTAGDSPQSAAVSATTFPECVCEPGGTIPCPSGFTGNQICSADCSGYDDSACTAIAGENIAWWKLDEISGGIAYDSVDGYDGELRNPPLFWTTEGVLGGALEIGSGTGHVYIPNGGGLNAAEQGSITMWVKWNGIQDVAIFGLAYGCTLGRQQNGVFSDNVIGLSGTDPSTATLRWISKSAKLTGKTPVGSDWRHVVVTFEPGSHKIYLDGILEDETAIISPMNDAPTVPLTIGAWINDGACYFTGKIDEVRIYNYVLTIEEIDALAHPPDYDNDGVYDENDNCPLISNENQLNTDKDLPDGDGQGDVCDEDIDADGICNVDPAPDPLPDGTVICTLHLDEFIDNCPLINNILQTDTDEDGFGDMCDDDNDNDAFLDVNDNCPINYNPLQEDNDNDGIGDACDPDDDNDGVLDDFPDNCQFDANPSQLDTDSDGIGNACEDDADGDGVDDSVDNCPNIPNPDQIDTDGDNLENCNLLTGHCGDACDDDDDNDIIPDAIDNCPLTSNNNQLDTDNDNFGDVCDEDDDNDGVNDLNDNCPLIANDNQLDTDSDGIGDACDTDDDNDGILDVDDNCQFDANPGQEDADKDGIGNVCEDDYDNDGIPNAEDNCPLIPNPDQTDVDGDGLGDVCDDDFELPTDPNLPGCGNNVVELNEQCDGIDLDGNTCITLAGLGKDYEFIGGTLACDDDTCTFDVRQCIEELPPDPNAPTIVCTSSFDCTAWSACVNGERSRTCVDSCSGESKIETNKDCTVVTSASSGGGGGGGGRRGSVVLPPTPSTDTFAPCAAQFECGEWSSCVDRLQTRVCNDLRRCYKPKTESKVCAMDIVKEEPKPIEPAALPAKLNVFSRIAQFLSPATIPALVALLIIIAYIIAGEIKSHKIKKAPTVADTRRILNNAKKASHINRRLAKKLYNDAVGAYWYLKPHQRKLFTKEIRTLQRQLKRK